ESFYRKQVETDIKTEPSKTAEERLKMMELLKRFEEDTLDDEGNIMKELAGAEGDEDGDDLASRLGNVDLESVSPDELWSMLTPEERDKFIKALDDPTSELAQQLLASEELEKVRTEPWWENPDASVITEDSISPAPVDHRLQKRYGKRPAITLHVPSGMVKAPSSSSTSLLYNACAMCIAYAYATRHLSVSPLSSASDALDVAEAQRLISSLVPFLVDRKSTLVHPNMSSVVTDLWSRFGQGQMRPKLFALLLRDTARLMRPSRVIEVQPPEAGNDTVLLGTHPNANVFRVFSDLALLFENKNVTSPAAPRHANTKPKPKPNHVTHKLTFYSAHVLSTPSFILDALANEAVARSNAMDTE
ncbi:hypothetical protein GLOTRDRAFT_28595, partial [Gloeophyllum trabeum ATCC 11539]